MLITLKKMCNLRAAVFSMAFLFNFPQINALALRDTTVS